VFSETPLSDLVPRYRGVVRVEETDTLEHALKLMKKENVSSVAVGSSDCNYTGILSTWDIIAHLCFGPEPLQHKISSIKCGEVKTSLLIMEASDSLETFLHADQLFKAYRCLVKTRDDEYEMLTTSDVVFGVYSRLLEGENVLQDKGCTKLKDSKIYSSPVTSVPSTITVRDGLEVIYKNNLNAVAVVDEEGKLVETLSASDLRGLTAETVGTIEQPITSFFVEKREQQTVTEEATLNQIIKKCVAHQVHRVWVVNSDYQPIGVVSFSDVISALVEICDSA